jgi:hypothetical protein
VARTRAALTAGALLVGVSVLLLLLSGSEEQALAEACGDLRRGSPVEAVFAQLGTATFRPSCERCTTLDLPVGAVRWSCTPEDCSQLWAAGDARCLVEFEGGRLTDAQLMRVELPESRP